MYEKQIYLLLKRFLNEKDSGWRPSLLSLNIVLSSYLFVAFAVFICIKCGYFSFLLPETH